jgi:hypothetical protein
MNQPVRVAEGFIQDDKPAAAPEPAPAPADVWPVKVKLLHKSVRNGRNEEVRELSFREPTGGDINRYGNPVRIDTAGEVIIDEQKMTLMMAGLSGVLSPMLQTMDPRDWNSCAYRLRGFFLPEFEAWG